MEIKKLLLPLVALLSVVGAVVSAPLELPRFQIPTKEDYIVKPFYDPARAQSYDRFKDADQANHFCHWICKNDYNHGYTKNNWHQDGNHSVCTCDLTDGCRNTGQSCTCSNTGRGGVCSTGNLKDGLYCQCVE